MINRRKAIARELNAYEEEEENDDAILKDGETFRVPLYMRDGVPNPALTPTQRAIAEDQIARSFGLSDSLAMHRPGFRHLTDIAALDRVEQAYDAYDQADSERWKTCGEPTDEFGGQQEGDVCTINGFPGHLNSKLECVPDKRDALPVLDEREAAYAAYDREQAERWRGR